jgi:hypothetical protein
MRRMTSPTDSSGVGTQTIAPLFAPHRLNDARLPKLREDVLQEAHGHMLSLADTRCRDCSRAVPLGELQDRPYSVLRLLRKYSVRLVPLKYTTLVGIVEYSLGVVKHGDERSGERRTVRGGGQPLARAIWLRKVGRPAAPAPERLYWLGRYASSRSSSPGRSARLSRT